MQAVVDVGGPHAREKQQDLVREEVHRAEEQGQGVGHGLQHAVQRVEGQPSKGGHRVLLVVLVVLGMQVPVGWQEERECVSHLCGYLRC